MVALLAGGSLVPVEDETDLDPYRRALGEILETPGSDVLVAEQDGQVVGMCQLLVFRHLQARGGRCAEVESLHVERSRRSQGIGAALIDEAVERSRRAGCYRIQLTCDTARVDAHRLYLRQGFAPSHIGFKRPLP
jgi:GNAT superfamily N-acetyltransferase